MSRLLIPAQRREWIDDYLSVHKIVRIADLSKALDVSEATIRRDLEWLESEGVLERTYGGAILSRRIQLEPEYAYRAQTHTEEKCQIGLAVADLVEDGDIIFVNSGTTSTQVIRHIPVRADVTVITNNISAALEVGETGFELILLGGTFQPRSNSVAGHFAIENLSHVYASKAFVGVDGVSLKYGCTVPTSGEAQVVRQMLERTRGLITVMADHSKWGVVSNFEIATIDQVHRLVTDDGLDPDAHAALAAHSVEILAAGTALGLNRSM